MNLEQLFLSALPTIERVVTWVCARRCLRGADAEDFASTVKLRLIENDYEVLGRFEGRSSLQTYLVSVVNRLYLDFQRKRFGKWRSSAEARRLGSLALRLEALLYRDGLSFDEACGVLQTEAPVEASRDSLERLRVALPQRVAGWRDAPAEALPQHAVEPSPVEQAERRALERTTSRILGDALTRLSARDRLLLRLHFDGGLSIADIARTLEEDQRPLYRKRDALLRRLRAELEAAGIQQRDAQTLLATAAWEAPLVSERLAAEATE